MYETAAEGLALHAPALALGWEQFIAPASWWLVPDESGLASRAELTLLETQQSTVKINIWLRPDLRGPGGTPLPHSHPWDFDSYILAGGYGEDRYRLASDGQVHAELGVTHQHGGTNRFGRDRYHEVTRVHAPGATMSLMVCGRGERGVWGYLDLDTGRHRRSAPDPTFRAKLRALNCQWPSVAPRWRP
ncbi:hypothetical protein [Streptomyces olivoreticuli]|uniref:hypothetical protein n=1 Tax=Streptomyces olivoreticuli TaxID=68246 RepID=UPI000E26119A|nr:hypothetical protein [Streptomyces olivoreticuli]